jgi:hypothetical protein
MAKWRFKAPKRALFYTFFLHFQCLGWSDRAPPRSAPLRKRVKSIADRQKGRRQPHDRGPGSEGNEEREVAAVCALSLVACDLCVVTCGL